MNDSLNELINRLEEAAFLNGANHLKNIIIKQNDLVTVDVYAVLTNQSTERVQFLIETHCIVPFWLDSTPYIPHSNCCLN